MNNILPITFSIENFITKPLILASTLIIGIGGAVVFVALMTNNSNSISNNYDSDSESDSDSNSKKKSDSDIDSDLDKNYEEKYLETYKKLENNDLNEAQEEIKFIEDLTPYGVVKLSYNIEDKHFLYYCNKKDIPYKYLETVARLFVIEKNCKNIFIDYDEELKKLLDRIADSSEKPKDNDEKPKDDDEKPKDDDEKPKDDDDTSDVFAKFKNYKTDKPKTNEKKWIIPDRMNQYKYKGTMRDFDDLIKDLSKNNKLINDEFEHLDYITFKKIKDQEKKTFV